MSDHIGLAIKRRLDEIGKTRRWLGQQVSPPVSDNAVSLWIKTGKISRDNQKQVMKLLGLTGEVLYDDKAQSVQLHYLTPAEFHIVDTYRQTTKMGQSLMDAAVMSARAHIPPKD